MPAPPQRSGTLMPSQPSSPIRCTISIGKRRSPLVLVDDGRDLRLHELADRVPQEHVVGREVEVHRSRIPPGRWAPCAADDAPRRRRGGYASSRSTTPRVAGSRRGPGTSETLGTNEAAIEVAAACCCCSMSRMPEPPERRQLVADVGLEHLGAVGADRVPDAVAVQLVEDPAELVPARHDAGVEVRGRADLEDDAALAEHAHRPRVVGRLHAVADAVGLEQLDDAGDLVDRPGLAGVDRDPEAVLAGAAHQAPVVGDPEGGRFGAGDVDADHPPVAPGDRLLHDDLVELERERAVEAEDQARLHRVLERRAVHAPERPPRRCGRGPARRPGSASSG